MRTILRNRIFVKFFLKECQEYAMHMYVCMHLIDNAYVCNLIDDKIMVGSTGLAVTLHSYLRRRLPTVRSESIRIQLSASLSFDRPITWRNSKSSLISHCHSARQSGNISLPTINTFTNTLCLSEVNRQPNYDRPYELLSSTVL
jgi:hypothetical protein